MERKLPLDTEFSREELAELFDKNNRTVRYQLPLVRRIRLRDDSLSKMKAVDELIDWEMEQILLEGQFSVDEFYETVESECPDPRTRPFVGCYSYYEKKTRKAHIYWYRPRPFKHPITGKQLVYGHNINKGANYAYNSRPFKKFPLWVQETVSYLEERNARKRRRVEILQKLRALLKQYRGVIEKEYY